MQLMLQRKAELAKNKAKYTLTETDGSLLVTHATELHFADGQVIVEGGHDISSVYRVKSGKISIFRNGSLCCELSQGYFIGDALLLYDHKTTYRMNVTLKANGPVELLQLDLDFVKRLFSLDMSLAMKFYRLLAVKSASILHQLVNTLPTPALLSSSLDSLPESTSISTKSLTSNPSTSSLSSSSSSTVSDSASEAEPAPSTTDAICKSTRPPLTKRKSWRLSRTNSSTALAYKVYPLLGSKHGVQTCKVKPKKIKVITRSFGFQHKVSIEFAKLNSITEIGDNAVTIIHQDKRFQTIFFKNLHDREEFMYLVSSLTTPANPAAPLLTNQPISTPPSPDEETEEDDPQVSKGEEHFRNAQVRVELKQGDRVFEEGDLYQRVHTIISGSLAVYQNGIFLHYLTEGQIFGVDTILFLRPCPVTVEVASETATLLIIPAYKMTELIDSDVAIAVHLFKRSAQILEAQIIKILQIEQQLQAPVSQNRKSQEILMQNSQGCIQKRQTQKLLRQSSHESLTAQSRKSQEFSAQLLRGSGGMPLPPAPIAQLSQN